MKRPISLFWFKNDLRIADNPALIEACRLGRVLPIYILDNLAPSACKEGQASAIYLHHSLLNLDKSLNNTLNVYDDNAEETLLHLIKKYPIGHIFWNRSYEPWMMQQDKALEKKLTELQVRYTILNDSYLWSPEEVKKSDGSSYKVFTAYKKKAYTVDPRAPLGMPKNPVFIKDTFNKTTIDDLHLISDHDLEKKIVRHWTFGETAAHHKLKNFINKKLAGYKKGRDYAHEDHTSKLSPNLHFGEISPHQVWDALHSLGRQNANKDDVEHFLNEIIWREFCAYLLYYFPNLYKDNFQEKFDTFAWEYNSKFFNAWKTGNTGYPLVDAGMRQLLQTGYMHNRVRMVTASFLVKNLMIHWHHGQEWFWNHLVDADLANNSGNWQWVAGSGADAAPYFRIFNPITQGEKFDKEGLYTKQYVPELKALPAKYLFKPWLAPKKVLDEAGIILGKTYPQPIIDINSSRKKALSAYTSLKKND